MLVHGKRTKPEKKFTSLVASSKAAKKKEESICELKWNSSSLSPELTNPNEQSLWLSMN